MGRRMAILTGREFGRLTVLGKDSRVGNGHVAYYRCKCLCGAEKVVRGTQLTSGVTRSCGCLHREVAASQREVLRRANTTHGLSRTRAYSAWLAMWKRCTDPSVTSYKWYGRRGISVCDRWRDVSAFVSDMGQPPPGFTLDRKDCSGNYEPSNCRWATRKEQCNNRTSNRLISYRGERKTVAQWASITGISETLLARRVRDGWETDAIFKTPARTKHSITHCKNGHEYTPENTIHSKGLRFCLACRQKRNRRAA